MLLPVEVDVPADIIASCAEFARQVAETHRKNKSHRPRHDGRDSLLLDMVANGPNLSTVRTLVTEAKAVEWACAHHYGAESMVDWIARGWDAHFDFTVGPHRVDVKRIATPHAKLWLNAKTGDPRNNPHFEALVIVAAAWDRASESATIIGELSARKMIGLMRDEIGPVNGAPCFTVAPTDWLPVGSILR